MQIIDAVYSHLLLFLSNFFCQVFSNDFVLWSLKFRTGSYLTTLSFLDFHIFNWNLVFRRIRCWMNFNTWFIFQNLLSFSILVVCHNFIKKFIFFLLSTFLTIQIVIPWLCLINVLIVFDTIKVWMRLIFGAVQRIFRHQN